MSKETTRLRESIERLLAENKRLREEAESNRILWERHRKDSRLLQERHWKDSRLLQEQERQICSLLRGLPIASGTALSMVEGTLKLVRKAEAREQCNVEKANELSVQITDIAKETPTKTRDYWCHGEPHSSSEMDTVSVRAQVRAVLEAHTWVPDAIVEADSCTR